MKNREETPVRQSRRRRLLPGYRIIILICLSAFLIQFVRNLDKQLRVITFDGSTGILRNEDRLAERTERDTHKNLPKNATSFSSITTSNTTFDNHIESPYLVEIRGNESFLWQGAQSRLCTHIKKERKKHKSQNRMHLILIIRCEDIENLNQHGNFMIGLYGMKVAAMAFQADFSFRCIEKEREDFMLWWLQTRNTIPATESTPQVAWKVTSHDEDNGYLVNENLYTPSLPTPDVACRGMGRVALQYASEYVRKEMRTMADELLPSMENKGITIDEVAIHLRCGDTISKRLSSKDQNYGLVQFQAYRKNIPPSAKSIGIITAPFSEANRRQQDIGSGEICRTLVFELVDYLESHFPNAEVHVRNSPNESIPEVVSRLIMAKHTFCIRSTFCLLPSIASYGTSYIQKGGVAYFIEDVSNVYDDVLSIDEPFLLSRDIRERGFNSTLKWLTES